MLCAAIMVMLLIAAIVNAINYREPGKVQQPEIMTVTQDARVKAVTYAVPEQEVIRVINYPIDEYLQEFIFEKSEEYGIDPYIIIAIGENESGWTDVGSVMDTNGLYSIGYMQINSICWDYLHENGFDVHTELGNIEGGIFLLSKYLEKYNLEKSLACYECGEGRVTQRQIESTYFTRKIIRRAEEIKMEDNLYGDNT